MIFLLTGVSKQNLEQRNPHKSLGGYVSSSLVPNGGLNSLFPSISATDLLEGSRVVRAIVLKNNSDGVIPSGSVLHYIKETTAFTNWRMAVVGLASDDCGYYMETLSDETALPSSAVFIDNDCNIHQIELPEIAVGEHYGIWIERRVNVNKAKATMLDCPTLYQEFLQGDVQQVMTIQTVAAVGGSLSDTQFFLSTPTAKYQFFFNEQTNTLPSVIQTGNEPVRIPIADNLSADQVATFIWKIINDVLGDRGEATATVEGNLVTITIVPSGPVSNIVDGTGAKSTGFDFVTTIPGTTSLQNNKQEGVTIYLDTP